MDGIVNMNKQEIKDLINSIETRISNRCHENGNEEIQVILYEMRDGKFFPNESVEIIGSVDYCEFTFDYQDFIIHFKEKDLYLEFRSHRVYPSSWAEWKENLYGHQVLPKEIKTIIYERVED